jgi:uracil-DNA glycosylase
MPTANQLATLLAEVRHSLTTLAGKGCPGFDVAPESLEKVLRWGEAQRSQASSGPIGQGAEAVAGRGNDLPAIRAKLGDCQRCGLAGGRHNIVFGSGDASARLVFVGEGPGRDEDLCGEPFVGPAGELLTKIIAAMGLTREAVYICNVVKCRPPKNRLPQPEEIAACLPFLKAQLGAIKPTVICTLGACASQILLETDQTISRLRGRFHTYAPIPAKRRGGCQVMPTFHPAYLLRNPMAKREVWADMQKIMKVLRDS